MFGKRVLLVSGAVMMALAPVAVSAADSVGRIQAANQTVVLRDGKLISAVSGMPIYSGDRVMTRQGGSARVVAANGCSASVSGSSVYSVAATGCTTEKGFAPKRGTLSATGNAAGQDEDSDHDSSTGYIVGGLAAAAIIGGVIAATSNTNTTPASP